MAGKLEVEIPEKWQIGKGGKVDVSTSARAISFQLPSDFQMNQVLGATNSITFDPQLESLWSFLDQAWFQIQFTVRDSVTHSAYASGAPVALNPDFSSTLCNNFYFQYGGQQVELESNYTPVSTFISNLIDYSADYAQFLGGLTDAFILDQAGQTQFSQGGQSGLENFALSNQSIIVTDTTSGALCQLVTNATPALCVKVIGNGTITAGDTLTLAYAGPNGTLVPVFANGGAVASTSFTVGTVTSGVAPILINSSDFTATNIVYFYAGTKAIPLYDITATKPILLGMTVTTSATSSTITLATATGAVGSIGTGDLLAFDNRSAVVSSTNNAGFWQRQALTDAGKVCNMRIPIQNIVKFFRTYKDGLYGQKIQIRLSVNPQQIANLVQVGTGYNPAEIYITDFQLAIPYEEPSAAITEYLGKWLNAKTPKNFIWHPRAVQAMPVIQSGNTSYAAAVTFPPDRTDWAVMWFVPQSYVGSSYANPQCSLVPSASSSTGNPITNAFITYGGKRYPPNSILGQNKSDIMQEWQTFLEIAGRTDQQLMAPCLNFQQYLQNYFMLIFDLRGRTGDNTAPSATTTVQIQFANAFSVTTIPYLYTIASRPASFTGIDGKMIYDSLNGSI